jgi:hypothetical protein
VEQDNERSAVKVVLGKRPKRALSNASHNDSEPKRVHLEDTNKEEPSNIPSPSSAETSHETPTGLKNVDDTSSDEPVEQRNSSPASEALESTSTFAIQSWQAEGFGEQPWHGIHRDDILPQYADEVLSNRDRTRNESAHDCTNANR